MLAGLIESSAVLSVAWRGHRHHVLFPSRSLRSRSAGRSTARTGSRRPRPGKGDRRTGRGRGREKEREVRSLSGWSSYLFSIPGIRILNPVLRPWGRKAFASPSSRSVSCSLGPDASAARTLPSTTPCLVGVTEDGLHPSLQPLTFKNLILIPSQI